MHSQVFRDIVLHCERRGENLSRLTRKEFHDCKGTLNVQKSTDEENENTIWMTVERHMMEECMILKVKPQQKQS